MDRKTQTSYTRRETVRPVRGALNSPVATEQTAPAVLHKTRRSLRFGRRVIVFALAGIVLLIGGGATYAQLGPSLTQNSTTGVNLQKGLVGWWKFDGNAKDTTVYHNTATIFGSSLTTDRHGKANSAYSFTTSSDYVSMPNRISGASEYTYSIWFKPNAVSTSTADGIIGSSNNPRVTWGIAGGNNSSIHFLTNYQTTGTLSCISGVLALNTWHHIAATVLAGNTSSPQIKLFIDGQQKCSATGTAALVAPSSLNINTRDSAHYLNGSVDDARIYNRVLNGNEAKAMYDGYSQTTNVASGEKGLVGWWKLDGNGNDATPLRNTMTVNNATMGADRKGAASKAYTFNGTNSILRSSAANLPGANKFTYSAWIKPNTSNINLSIIGPSTSTAGPLLRVSANNRLTLLDNTMGTMCGAQSVTISASVWTHVAVTYDSSGSCAIYINGSSVSVNAAAIAVTSGGVSIGAFRIGQDFWNGSIDDVRIYNRLLSANEVASQYKSYDSQISINSNSNNVNTSTGLVGYWPFNGNANDRTPYRNNAALIGSSPPVLTSDRNSKSNSAYNFDGNSQMETTSVRLYNYKNFTYSAWINPTSASGIQTIINSRSSASGYTSGAQFRYTTNKIQLVKAQIVNICISTGTFNPGVWTFVAVTYDSDGNCTFYINGVASGVSMNPNTFTPGYAVFGHRGGSAESLIGGLDDIRIYERVLSAGDIAKLYTDYR